MLKKIIVAIVAIIVITIVIKGLKKDTIGLKDEGPNPEENVPITWYEMRDEKPSIKYILGAFLPDSAENIHAFINFGGVPGADTKKFFWLVADLPREDFHALVQELGLEKTSDLLDFWPDAFECDMSDGHYYLKHWVTANKTNNDTYYGEVPKYEGQIVMKYEDGKIFFKKEIIYVEHSRNEDGHILYMKSERD